MRYTNTYTKRKRADALRRFKRTASVSLALLFVSTVAISRFFVGQAIQDEASTDADNPAEVAAVPQREARSFESFEQVETIAASVEDELQSALEAFTASHDADISVYVAALDGSFEAGVHSTAQYDSASLYKTLAAYIVLQRVDAGELSLDEVYAEGVPLERCLELAIVVSDNPCGIALQKLAQPYRADSDVQNWGYTHTSLSGYYPQSSAFDQHTLFSDIYAGKRLSTDSQQLLLGFLRNQQILNRTPSYDDATLYLKTADLEGVVHSAALVESSESVYTISIFTDNWGTELLSKYSAIADIHEQVHEVITQNERPQ